MIDLKGKHGEGLIAYCLKNGQSFYHENGIPKSANDVAVQALIDAYDPLPDAKLAKIALIKTDGLARINALFPAITSVDQIEFYSEFWLSIKSTSRAATANFQKVIDIFSAAKTAITSVNAATTTAGVNAVIVNWPA